MGIKDRHAGQVLWDTWDAFWQETSISGVNNAGKARNSFLRRLCWIGVFILGAFATGFSMNIVITEYMDFPVTTTITIEHKDQVIYVKRTLDTHMTINIVAAVS